MITDEMRDKWKDKINSIYRAFEVDQIELNEWESDFIESLYERTFNQNKDLSWKQTKILNRIYEKIG